MKHYIDFKVEKTVTNVVVGVRLFVLAFGAPMQGTRKARRTTCKLCISLLYPHGRSLPAPL